MRTIPRCFPVALLAAWLFGACEQDDGSNAIILTSGSAVELHSVSYQKKTLEFTTSASWTASCPADWLSFSPKKGESGNHVMTLTTTSTNRTRVTRSAQLTITSGTDYKNVTIVQSGKYAVFNKKEVEVSADGGTIALEFTSNLGEDDNLQIGYNQLSWISWADEARRTRADWTGTTSDLVVKPNTSPAGRTAVFTLVMLDEDNNQLNLDTAYVHQAGVTDSYKSTDYSADGTVTTLQRATKGRGIPFVLMGDGFADKDVADGTYDRTMAKVVENLFSEEPVKSLRDYFDIYSVAAVSESATVGMGYSTVFSCVPSILTSSIDCDEEQVDKYVKKVPQIDAESTLAIVILNSSVHNGVTYLYADSKGVPLQHSIALCPVIDNLQSETFRQVLVHEAIGHGLAKLADEYGYEDNGIIPEKQVEYLTAYHYYGWMQNVDTTDRTDSVCWKLFFGDSRFANEAIGVYEGGFTYATGVWRPTEESMMNSNRSPFNAPSRKAIYDRVMLLGEGRAASTLDEFAAFDEAHKPVQWSYAATRSYWQPYRHFAPPIVRRE